MPEKLSIEQFGATIKEKYPQYSGLSDAEIGAKTLARYPEYSSRVATPELEKTGFVQDIKGIGTGIKESFNKRKEGIGESFDAQGAGDQNLAQTAFQTIGQGAGFVSDAIGSTVVGGIKAATPQGIQEGAGDLIEAGAGKVMETGFAQSIMDNYENLDEERKRDVDAVLGITSLASEFLGGSVVKQGVKKGAKAFKQAAEPVVSTASKASRESADVLKQIGGATKVRISDQILPIDDVVRTTLKRSNPETFAKHIDQAKKASLDQKAFTPLELAGEKASEALETIQRKLSSVGQQKSDLMQRAKVGNKRVGNEAIKSRRNILNEIGDATLDNADQSITNDILTRLTTLGNNPQLKQIDDFVDYAQEQLFKSDKNLTISVGGNTERILKGEIKRLNDIVKKNAPESYRTLNAKYADQVNLRNKLNKALGKEGTKGGSLLKRVFSPTDGGTKTLFDDVLKATGIDLTDEAVLAKFAMELYGDARQASILQQLSLPTKTGIIDKILETAGGVAGLDDALRNMRIKKAKKIQGTGKLPNPPKK